jgi:hypothetical protein
MDGYIICDWLGQSIHGGYPCTGGDERGEGQSIRVGDGDVHSSTILHVLTKMVAKRNTNNHANL